ELNVDFMGLIFAKSPRQLSLEQAMNLSDIIHAGFKKSVGVFVDENLEFILKAIKQAKLDGVQIHRKISEFEFKTLKESGVFVWQVLSVGDCLELEEN
ncbi:phosphoribosylanthranilate isomerase, partial [Campylobacter coli]|nr:phosphoribosylanthranilate isomerase [Campylobacter coli]